MKSIYKIFTIFILLLVVLIANTKPAQAGDPAKRITGGSFTLESGEALDEELEIMGGTVVLEKDSLMNGDIQLTAGTLWMDGKVNGNIRVTGGIATLEQNGYIVGNIETTGSLSVAGTVNGDIHATSGVVTLLPTARIDGNVETDWAVLNRDAGAQVTGKILERDQRRLVIPGLPEFPEIRLPGFDLGLNSVWAVIWFFMRVFIFSALAVLLAMFFPRSLERTAHTAVAQPLISGGLGLFTLLVSPFVVIVMALTVLLIPVAFVGVLLMGIMLVMGWIALGYETGQRLARVLKQEWATPLSAGLGTFLLTFVLLSIGFIPCIGALIAFAAGMVGLGAVALTVFGTRDYPPSHGLSSSTLPVQPIPQAPLVDQAQIPSSGLEHEQPSFVSDDEK